MHLIYLRKLASLTITQLRKGKQSGTNWLKQETRPTAREMGYTSSKSVEPQKRFNPITVQEGPGKCTLKNNINIVVKFKFYV